MEAQVALIVAFRCICIVGSDVSHLPLDLNPTDSGQSSTVTLWSLNQLLVRLAEWEGAKACWKMSIISQRSRLPGHFRALHART